MAFIYVITNNINGKQYVGKTTDTIKNRFKDHKHDRFKKTHEKRPLYDAMNKYGVENFSIGKLEECSTEIVAEREQYWIDKLNTFHNGYNATKGGDGKILYDYKELANKYLELGTVKETAEYFNCDRDTIRKACLEKGVVLKTSGEISKEKTSKAVQCLSKNGELLKIFNSLSDGAQWLLDNNEIKSSKGTIVGHIGEVCQGKRLTAYKYKWKYI